LRRSLEIFFNTTHDRRAVWACRFIPVTGFLWNTLDELRTSTRLLVEDDALWTRMSAAARARAADFSRARFVDQVSRACGVEAVVPLEPGCKIAESQSA
jgi:hypothetical protein